MEVRVFSALFLEIFVEVLDLEAKRMILFSIAEMRKYKEIIIEYNKKILSFEA